MSFTNMKNVIARSRKATRPSLVVLFFVVLLFSSVSFAAEAATQSQKIPLPAAIRDSLPWFAVFELQNDNAPFTRNHLNALAQKNERVALVYFATWCIPCREGLKQISTNAEALAAAKTAVVLVNVGEREKDSITKFLEQFSLEKLPAVVDPFGRLTEGFGLIKEGENIDLPRTVVVDKKMHPSFMIGAEGADYIQILKGEK